MVYHKNIQHLVQHEKPPIIKLLQSINLITWVVTQHIFLAGGQNIMTDLKADFENKTTNHFYADNNK